MSDVTVNAELFRIVATVCSQEETRFYLGGVLVEPRPEGGVFLVATDGHRMLVAWDDSGKAKTGTIVKLDKLALAACKPGRRERRFLSVKAGDAQILARKIEDEGALGKPRMVAGRPDVVLEADYPQWRRVIPRVTKPTAPIFMSAYLTDMASAGLGFRVASHDPDLGPAPRVVPMRLSAQDKHDPAIVRWGGVENAFGVLMPVRDDGVDGIPAFLSSLKKAA